MLVAMAHAGHHVAAPVAVGAPLHYGHAIAHHAPAIVGTQVHEHVVPGPTYHTTHQEVVGHRTVQVGSQAVTEWKSDRIERLPSPTGLGLGDMA